MKFKSKLLAALTALSLAATCVSPLAAFAANEAGFVAEKTAEEPTPEETVYISEDGEETDEPEYFEEEPEEEEEIEEAAFELFSDETEENTVEATAENSVAVAYSDDEESGTYYTDFDSVVSAIDAGTITDGMTIKLLTDATWTLTANKTIKIGLTFDLNGNTLTLSGNKYIQFQPADSTSKVAFIDSSYTDETGETAPSSKVIGSYGGSYAMLRITKACSVELKNVIFENENYGYVMEIGTTSGVAIDLDADNCEFVNSNTENKSSTTTNYVYSRAMMLYGNGSKATDGQKLSLTNCKFETTTANSGYALNVSYGKSAETSNIEIDGCEIISNGSVETFTSGSSTYQTSPTALNLGVSLCSTINVTNSIITAPATGRAIATNYNISSSADITMGDGNVVTGKVNLGNGSGAAYNIKVTGGCFTYNDGEEEQIPFVVASETGTSLSSLLTLTGGYFKTDVSSIIAGNCVCSESTEYDGYTYAVSKDTNAGENSIAYTVTDGAKTYYDSLYAALSAADDTADEICFFTDCELTDAAATLVVSSGKTITNYGSATLTYAGTLSELMSSITGSTGTGSVQVQTLSYKYDDSTAHSISNAEITSEGLVSGTLNDMKATNETNWNYYKDGVLSDNYAYYYADSKYTVIGKDSDTAAAAEARIGDNLYVKTLSSAVSVGRQMSEKTVTMLKDVTHDFGIVNSGYTVTVDLNGYTLTGYVYIYNSSYYYANNADITFKNGTIDASSLDCGYVIYTSGNLTGVSLTLDNVTLKAGDNIGMYLASGGTTTITDCEITGATGIVARSSDISITDTTITATGTAYEYDATYSGGAQSTGDALVLIASNYPGGAPSVEIFSGNTMTSGNANAVVCYTYTSVEEDSDDDIQNKQFITDGTYNTDISEYVKTGYYQNQTTGVVLKSTTTINNTADATLSADDTATIDIDKGATATVTLTNLADRIEAASADESNTFTYDPTEAAEIYVVLNTDDVADFPETTDAELGTDYFAVDISVVKKVNGVETEIPVTEVDVEVELPVAPDSNGVTVYHITETGKAEKIGISTDNDGKVTLSDNVVSFTASSFSTYYFEYKPLSALTASDIATSISLELVQNGDEGNYKIYLKGDSGAYINRFMAAELAFTLDQSCDITNIGAVTITPADYINITSSGDGEYAFNVQDPAEEVSDITGKSVLLGYLTVIGNGTFRLLLNESPKVNTANQVQTAEVSNNIVSTYITTASTDGKLNYSTPVASGEITLTPTSLTINVMFPNAVSAQNAEYNDMKVTVTGMGVDEEIEIGQDKQTSGLQTVTIDGAETGTDDYTDATGYVANATVYAGYTYTLEFSGAGYRTFRTSVTPTYGAATVTVWNNAMDKDMVVVTDTDDAMGGDNETVTFLAGDIVANDKIDLWDLSAVVSYFGKGEMTSYSTISEVEDYIKYDLNRDGKIDSRDIAMVLVSWNY
ncbi:MAG: dockerin type I domain-containing protein [Firmicutes bacterium]|nr:dockerin type I domain-containing protein [Bacillota bacterium]